MWTVFAAPHTNVPKQRESRYLITNTNHRRCTSKISKLMALAKRNVAFSSIITRSYTLYYFINAIEKKSKKKKEKKGGKHLRSLGSLHSRIRFSFSDRTKTIAQIFTAIFSHCGRMRCSSLKSCDPCKMSRKESTSFVRRN